MAFIIMTGIRKTPCRQESSFPFCGIIWQEERRLETSKKEIERLFELLVRLYKDGLIEVESVRQMVDKMEVE